MKDLEKQTRLYNTISLVCYGIAVCLFLVSMFCPKDYYLGVWLVGLATYVAGLAFGQLRNVYAMLKMQHDIYALSTAISALEKIEE